MMVRSSLSVILLNFSGEEDTGTITPEGRVARSRTNIVYRRLQSSLNEDNGVTHHCLVWLVSV